MVLGAASFECEGLHHGAGGSIGVVTSGRLTMTLPDAETTRPNVLRQHALELGRGEKDQRRRSYITYTTRVHCLHKRIPSLVIDCRLV